MSSKICEFALNHTLSPNTWSSIFGDGCVSTPLNFEQESHIIQNADDTIVSKHQIVHLNNTNPNCSFVICLRNNNNGVELPKVVLLLLPKSLKLLKLVWSQYNTCTVNYRFGVGKRKNSNRLGKIGHLLQYDSGITTLETQDIPPAI
jgi:hypothetical protein